MVYYSYTVIQLLRHPVVMANTNGFLSVMFTHRHTDLSFVINVCYLPPDNSVWGRDATVFFSHILGEIYKYSDVDVYICVGDFNARIGKLSDTIVFFNILNSPTRFWQVKL